MQIEAIRRSFTADEYDRMLEAGILGRRDRVELIEGEILEMSPIGNRHEACVDRAAAILVPPLLGRAIVRVQGSIRFGNYSRPQPDLILLQHRQDFYASTGAEAKDVLLVIEIAESSIAYDRGPKLRVYARHGVREVWIEDLTTEALLVFRDPERRAYRTESTLRPGDSVSPIAFPELAVPISSLLGVELG